MRRRWARAGLCVSALWCVHALAHHSGAMFDLETEIELRGVIVDFKLRSPHASFVVDAQRFLDDEPLDAVPARWEVEWEAAPILRTLGIEPDTFTPGDDITILALPHRDRTFRFAHAFSVIDTFGEEFTPANSDRKFAPTVRSAAAAVTGETIEEDEPTSAAATGLAGRWQQPLLNFPAESPKFRLNDAGETAWRNFDHAASPANTCEPMNVPGVFLAPFFMFELTLDAERVTLRNEVYNVVRTVPLAGRRTAVDENGRFGRATARIADGVLTVKSRDFPPSGWGLGHEEALGGADLPSSEKKTLTETFAVTPDGRTLVYAYRLFDPTYMSEPYIGRVELTRAPEDTPIHAYDCDLESAAMWSRSRNDAPLRIGE